MPSSRRTPRRRKHPRADMESAPTANSKRRSKPGKRAAARPRGRAMALPYKPSEMPRQTGTAVTTRSAVGRDALIPPHPAAAHTSAGGYGIRPYE